MPERWNGHCATRFIAQVLPEASSHGTAMPSGTDVPLCLVEQVPVLATAEPNVDFPIVVQIFPPEIPWYWNSAVAKPPQIPWYWNSAVANHRKYHGTGIRRLRNHRKYRGTGSRRLLNHHKYRGTGIRRLRNRRKYHGTGIRRL